MKRQTKLTTKKENKPLVSVVIPVYNGASFLEEAVLSILDNTYTHVEVLLIDDGSKDTSKEICRKLAKRYSKVKFFHFKQNKGMDYALNLALKRAKGKYICRLNQDDRMMSQRIEKQVFFLEKHTQVAAVGSSIILFDQYGRRELVYFSETDKEIKQIWHVLSPFSDPAVMYRKETAIEVGGYDQSFWPADDVHLWYRLGKAGKLANIVEPLVEVRWHSDAGSVKHFRTQIKRTYKLHMWTTKYVDQVPWYVHAFWIIQFIFGMTCSPEFNWGVYRVIKRFIALKDHIKLDPYKTKNTIPIVNIHPTKLKISGV